ncbi:hypothetical protein AAE478_010442 [Parahypoxylon ruwenzoriense]
MAWACGSCEREFGTLHARKQHMNVLDHEMPEHECDICERYFGSRKAVEQHMDAKDHWLYECSKCDEEELTAEELKEHEVDEHQYCSDCDRSFNNPNDIKMHLNSRIHRGADMKCPFCSEAYTSATGLSHHLERGSCPDAPSLDRDMVYKIVRSKDSGGLISKKLLDWNGSPKYEANREAWNGDAWECYFCNREFRSLRALNQHLASPAHQQNLYHCPKRSDCGREFRSFAALMNHLESESCGYTRFENVQNAAKNIVSGDRRITFH